MNQELTVLYQKIADHCQSLQPDQFTVLSSTAIGEHYTFVCPLPKPLQTQLLPIYNDLADYGTQLFLTDPRKYHLTIFTCDASQDLKRLKSALTDTIAALSPLEFYCQGIFAASDAIVAAALPTNETRTHIDSQLASLTNQSPQTGLRKALRWISLARYKQTPNQQLLKELQPLAEFDLGLFRPDEILIYRSRDRMLDDATLLERIPLT